MEFGLFLQPFHHPSEDPTDALDRDLDLVVLLDELGYSEAWVGEHHSTGWENIASPELFIATASERTDNIRFGTGVVQLGLHHPLVLLDRMILLDHLTRGRVSFGIGVGGGVPSDLTVFGLDPTSAGERMQESIDVMLELLESTQPVSAKSDWFEIHEATLQIQPYTQPHMPFAVASGNPRNVELMGRLGGKVLLGPLPHMVPDVLAWLEKGAADVGRAASRDQIMLSYMMHVDTERDVAVDSFKDGAIREFYEFQVGVNGRPQPSGTRDDWYAQFVERSLIGSPSDVREKIAEIQEASGGVGGFIFMTREWAGIDANRRSWKMFAEEVAPGFA